MALIKGFGKKTIGKNIATERDAGKGPKAAVAVALNTAREAAKKKGVLGKIKGLGKAPPKKK